MIYTHIAAGIGGAVLAGALAWNVQGWRLGEQIQSLKHDHAQQVAAAEQAKSALEASLNKKLQDAQNAASKREQSIRASADRARNELDSLRDLTYSIRTNLPGYSLAAATQTADTAAELLGQCAEQYRAVAEAADRHAADAVMLLEAWPK